MTVESPRAQVRRRDPLVGVFVVLVVLMLIAGITLGISALRTRDAAPPAVRSGGEDSVERIKRSLLAQIDALLQEDVPRQQPPATPAKPPAARNKTDNAKRDATAPTATPAPSTADPARVFAAIDPPAGAQVLPVPMDAKWRYNVYFGPGFDKAGELRYETYRLGASASKLVPQADMGKIGANMHWAPNSGNVSSWFFGVIEPDHPSHANTRFPGFFMHASYIPRTVAAGGRVIWEVPWQGGGRNQARRWDMRSEGWQMLELPAGRFAALHLKGKLQYVDNEVVKAEIDYSLWYSPAARQVVRVVWQGRAPDEGNTQMIVELGSFSAP